VTWTAGFLYMYVDSSPDNLKEAQDASARALELGPARPTRTRRAAWR